MKTLDIRLKTRDKPTMREVASVAGLVFLLGMTSASAQQILVQPFGNGYAIGAPGEPPVLVQPFGNGYTVAQPGQAPTLVQPFGNGWIVTPPPNGPIQPIVPIPPIGGIGAP
jgi:hypothetical protein